MDQIDQIIAYEQGELNQDETIQLFQNLVNSGLVWKLQGHYGRTAIRLIETGHVAAHFHDDDFPEPIYTGQ